MAGDLCHSIFGEKKQMTRKKKEKKNGHLTHLIRAHARVCLGKPMQLGPFFNLGRKTSTVVALSDLPRFRLLR